eukprot:m.239260 g.239260  ORF g.239260 m.239260 type:complete len:1041 (+) comp40178_c1_seq1:192-3314(+)
MLPSFSLSGNRAVGSSIDAHLIKGVESAFRKCESVGLVFMPDNVIVDDEEPNVFLNHRTEGEISGESGLTHCHLIRQDLPSGKCIESGRILLNNKSICLATDIKNHSIFVVDDEITNLTWMDPIAKKLRHAGEQAQVTVLVIQERKREPNAESLRHLFNEKLSPVEITVQTTVRGKLHEKIRAILRETNQFSSIPEDARLRERLQDLKKRVDELRSVKAVTATLEDLNIAQDAVLLDSLRRIGVIWYRTLPSQDQAKNATVEPKTRVLMDFSAPEKLMQRLKNSRDVIRCVNNVGYIKGNYLRSMLTADDLLCLSFLEYTGQVLRKEDNNLLVIPRLLGPREPTPPTRGVRLKPLLIKLKDSIVLPTYVFYEWAVTVATIYPHGVRFHENEALMRVAADHELHLRYGRYNFEVGMTVDTKDSTLQTTNSGEICSRIRIRLLEHFKTVCTEVFGHEMTVQIGVAAFSPQDSLGPVEFVDLTGVNQLSACTRLESDLKYQPPASLYTWYNECPPECEIQKNYSKYVDDLKTDFHHVMSFLIRRKFLADSDVSRIYGLTDSTAQANLLLSLLMSYGKSGDAILERAWGKTPFGLSVPQAPLQALKQSLDDPIKDREAAASRVDESFKLFQSIPPPPPNYPASALPRGHISQPTDNDQPQESAFVANTAKSRVLFGPPVALSIPQSAAAPLEYLLEGPLSPKPSSRPDPSFISPPAEVSLAKGDPKVTPVFEAKYYHVERASDHFNERPFRDGGKRLGAGSFGTVYHGVLHSETGDKFEVAIKRLKKASTLNPAQIELCRKQFGVEMNILTRYCHKNVIGLIGFSSDGPELCLIFEYMSNGALSHRLDCRDNSPPLPWKTRLSISSDVATGLTFLHTEYRLPVIHRDIKSSNVLLNSTFQAKLSDFGLAIVGTSDREMEGPVGPSVGTRPYMAPETFHKVVTIKADVYGFGMILYELATGLPPYSSKKKQDLKSYVDDIEQQGIDLSKMLDPKARWPKGRDAREAYGLRLLDVARKATIKDYKRRPEVKELLPTINELAEKCKT